MTKETARSDWFFEGGDGQLVTRIFTSRMQMRAPHIYVINSPHPSALLSPSPSLSASLPLQPHPIRRRRKFPSWYRRHKPPDDASSSVDRLEKQLRSRGYSRDDGMTWLVISADARQIAPSHFTVTFDSTDTAICIFPRGIAPKLLTKISPMTLSSTLFHQHRVRSTVRICRRKIVT